jgi:hypothetical protein
MLTLDVARQAHDLGTRWLPPDLDAKLVQLCQIRGTIGTQVRLFPHPAEWCVLTYLEANRLLCASSDPSAGAGMMRSGSELSIVRQTKIS